MKNYAFFTAIILLLVSCSKKNIPKSNEKVITKFVFTKANNPSLTEDVEGVITGNEIKVILHGLAKTSLKPTITYTSKSISANEEAKDFTNPVTYTLTAEDGSTVNYTVKVDSRDVYIAGYIRDGQNDYPAYWKNGNKIILPLGGRGTDGNLVGLVVSGNDVYAAGTTDGAEAVYWKNGTLVQLAPNAISSSVLDIILNNGDVYILYSITNNNTSEYAYWKNGVITIINGNMANKNLNRIYINGNDVYFGGYILENNQPKPAYWKNGNQVVLSDGSGYNSVSLSIHNNDIYAFGTGQQQLGIYWKNGTKNTYSFDNNDYISGGIIIGNDIYMIGNYSSAGKEMAVYWKNGGVKTNLGDGIKHTNASLITAFGNDIYIAGKERNMDRYSLIYWFNGKKISINTEEDYSHMSTRSIFVKNN